MTLRILTLGSAVGMVLACHTLHAQQALPPGRPLSTNDVYPGSISVTAEEFMQQPDGTRKVTKHVGFPSVAFTPLIVTSVTQIAVDVQNGHLDYSVTDETPACRQPKSADMQCDGVDITIQSGRSTEIRRMTVVVLILDALNPALYRGVSAQLGPSGPPRN